MSTDDPDEVVTSDPQGDRATLAPLAAETVATLKQRIRESPPAPDFAAMLARVREIDPAALPHGRGEPAENLTAVVALANDDAAMNSAPALARFTAILRTELDARLGVERTQAVIPPSPAAGRRRTVLVAIAAAVMLTFAMGIVLVGQRQESVQTGSQASDQVTAEPQGGLVREGSEQGVSFRPPGDLRASPAPDIQGPVDVPKEPVSDHSPTLASPAPAPARRPTPKATAGPSLEDEAQALWQRGELAAAEQKYRQILRAAGRSPRAEFAYADLFSLTRQSHGVDGQSNEWRAYLKLFPRGRFAEDARAGICQRAPDETRASCWRDYLKHHPSGVHRKQAEAALVDGANTEGSSP